MDEDPLANPIAPEPLKLTVLPAGSIVTKGLMLLALKGVGAPVGDVIVPVPVKLIESPIGVPCVKASAAPAGTSTELPTEFKVILVPAEKLVPLDRVCEGTDAFITVVVPPPSAV